MDTSSTASASQSRTNLAQCLYDAIHSRCPAHFQAALQRLGTPQQQAALCQNVHVQGKTLLQHAASLGCADVVQTLLALRCDPWVMNRCEYGGCALHEAVRALAVMPRREASTASSSARELLHSVSLLLQAGSDPFLENIKGLTAHDLASIKPSAGATFMSLLSPKRHVPPTSTLAHSSSPSHSTTDRVHLGSSQHGLPTLSATQSTSLQRAGSSEGPPVLSRVSGTSHFYSSRGAHSSFTAHSSSGCGALAHLQALRLMEGYADFAGPVRVAVDPFTSCDWSPVWLVVAPRRYCAPFGCPPKARSHELLLYSSAGEAEPLFRALLDGCRVSREGGGCLRLYLLPTEPRKGSFHSTYMREADACSGDVHAASSLSAISSRSHSHSSSSSGSGGVHHSGSASEGSAPASWLLLIKPADPSQASREDFSIFVDACSERSQARLTRMHVGLHRRPGHGTPADAPGSYNGQHFGQGVAGRDCQQQRMQQGLRHSSGHGDGINDGSQQGWSGGSSAAAGGTGRIESIERLQLQLLHIQRHLVHAGDTSSCSNGRSATYTACSQQKPDVVCSSTHTSSESLANSRSGSSSGGSGRVSGVSDNSHCEAAAAEHCQLGVPPVLSGGAPVALSDPWVKQSSPRQCQQQLPGAQGGAPTGPSTRGGNICIVCMDAAACIGLKHGFSVHYCVCLTCAGLVITPGTTSPKRTAQPQHRGSRSTSAAQHANGASTRASAAAASTVGGGNGATAGVAAESCGRARMQQVHEPRCPLCRQVVEDVLLVYD